ncbi:hypothetical protein VTO73DRAFT_2893 [Trametes versicolor]
MPACPVLVLFDSVRIRRLKLGIHDMVSGSRSKLGSGWAPDVARWRPGGWEVARSPHGLHHPPLPPRLLSVPVDAVALLNPPLSSPPLIAPPR